MMDEEQYPLVVFGCMHGPMINCKGTPELLHLLARLGLKNKLVQEYWHPIRWRSEQLVTVNPRGHVVIDEI